MNNGFKRVIAWIVDFFFIMLIVNILTYNQTTNPYYEKYMKNYDELVKLQESFQNDEIDEETFLKTSEEINYNLARNSVIINSVLIVLIIVYFGVFQYFNKGETLGKKLFKLRVVSNNSKKINVEHFVLRSVILNSIIFRLLSLVGPYFLNPHSYSIYSYFVGMSETIVECIIFMMVMLRKDGRGLHDILGNTKVESKTE